MHATLLVILARLMSYVLRGVGSVKQDILEGISAVTGRLGSLGSVVQ